MWARITELRDTLTLQRPTEPRRVSSKETLVVGTRQTVAQALRRGAILRCCECKCGIGISSDVGRFHMWDGDSLWVGEYRAWVKCPTWYTPETLEEQWEHNHTWEMADPLDPKLPEIPVHGLPTPESD